MKIRIIVFIFISLLAAGCASTPTKNGGKLSDAMNKASTEYEGDRVVNGTSTIYSQSRTNFSAIDVLVQTAQIVKSEPTETHSDRYIERPHFVGSVGMSRGIAVNKDFSTATMIDVAWTAVPENENELALTFSSGQIGVKTTSNLKSSIDWVSVARFGVRFDKYYLPSGDLVRPFIDLGISYDLMNWNYRNPLQLQDGSSFSNDKIDGVGVLTGGGILFAPYKNLQISIHAQGVQHFFSNATGRGFENDVIGNFPVLSIGSAIRLRF